MISRKSINLIHSGKNVLSMNTNMKKPIRQLITSGASTKASPVPSKEICENIENSSRKENTKKYINSLSISPTPRLNPLRLDFQSDFISHKKRKRNEEIFIRDKKQKNLKNSKMSLELKDPDGLENEFFRLYHEEEIMPDEEMSKMINQVECDNDCPTDTIQVNLAVKYLEAQLRAALGIINKNN